MKKILLFMSALFMFLSFNYEVRADTVVRYYVQDTESTKETYWYANDYYTYPNQYIVFATNTERYVTLSTCLTGNLEMDVTKNINGNIEFYDVFSGASCEVRGYNGAMYYFIFYVNDFYDAGSGQWGVYFDLKISNNNSYRVEQDIFNVSSSAVRPTIDNYDQVLNDINGSLGNINDSINDTNDKIDDTNDKLDDLNDNLTNDNVSGATSSAGNFFSGFETDTFGLTSIITAPLTLIQSITNSSCSSLGLPLPYVNKNIHLPCLSSIYQQYFGSFLTLYQTITFGIVAYWVCVRIFALVKDFKNPDHDEVEVLDL